MSQIVGHSPGYPGAFFGGEPSWDLFAPFGGLCDTLTVGDFVPVIDIDQAFMGLVG